MSKKENKKVIRSIYVSEVGWFHSTYGAIEEFQVNGEMAYVTWYRAKNEMGKEVELNGKYVVLVEYE